VKTKSKDYRRAKAALAAEETAHRRSGNARLAGMFCGVFDDGEYGALIEDDSAVPENTRMVLIAGLRLLREWSDSVLDERKN
jgi:hypothetical protein